MKYVIVAANSARGRNGMLFKRIELARVPEEGTKERPTQADSVLSVTVTDQESTLWSKEVDDTVEIT